MSESDQPVLSNEDLRQLLRETRQIRTTLGKLIAILLKMNAGQFSLDLKRDLGVDPAEWQERVVPVQVIPS